MFQTMQMAIAALADFFVMSITRERLKTVSIMDLVPTQVTVGMREVDFKRRRWREEDSHHKAASYLSSHSIPVILGPGNRYYIIDRHHLTRALHDEGVSEVPASVVADMSALRFDEFWIALESRRCTHPLDHEGRRRSYNDMPKTVFDLIDDPWRSLAWALKRVGGYAKGKAPFSEFRWADFLRSRIARETVEHDFASALALAIGSVHGREATNLPGWLGATSGNLTERAGAHATSPDVPLIFHPEETATPSLKRHSPRFSAVAEKDRLTIDACCSINSRSWM